jgi:hypothetical protein
VISDSYGYKPVYLLKTEDNRIDVLIPAMEINSYLTGKRLVSLPFSDFCMPIISEDSVNVFNTIFTFMHDLALKENIDSIEFNSINDLEMNRTPAQIFYGHILDLSLTEENLFKNFRKGTKSSILKSGREGVSIKICDGLDAMYQYYEIHAHTRKRLGLPPQPFKFFKTIHENLIHNKMGIISLAFYNEKCIAGAVYLQFGEKGLYKFSASDYRYHNLSANNLLMWESIRYLKSRNVRELHLGKTDYKHEGLRIYKRGWGTAEHTIKFYKYVLKTKSFVVTNSYPPKIFTHVCRYLPLTTLKLIGRLFYKHFA